MREKFKTVMIVTLIIMAITVAVATGIKDSGIVEEHVTITDIETGKTIYDGPKTW